MLRLIGTKKKGSLLEAGKINEPDFRVEIIIMIIVGFTELLSSTTQTNKQLSNRSGRVRARLFSDLRYSLIS